MIPPELRQQVLDRIKECKQIVLDKLGIDLGPIEVKFDLTGSIAGTARHLPLNKKCQLRLNQNYLLTELESMLKNTIPHEVAHLAADVYFNRQCHHSRYWMHIMITVFGIRHPPVYNYYNTPEAKLDREK